MPLKVRFLTKCHTKKRRGRRIIKTKQCSYQESVRYTSVALCAVAPPWHCVYLRPLRDSVCLLYKTFSLSLHISEESQFIPMSFIFVNYFCAVQNQYMLFWLLKDAQLACKRCPLSPLLTPFWRPIKHLFSCYFITNWFPVGCRLASYMCFCR